MRARRRLLVPLLAGGLVTAAACGADGDDAAAPGDTTTTVAQGGDTTTTVAGDPTTTTTTRAGEATTTTVIRDADDILEAARGVDGVREFVLLLQAAQLDIDLTGPGPFTVFAPNDEALGRVMDRQQLQDLMSQERRNELRQVLEHHVVERRLSEDDLRNERSVQMASGSGVDVTERNGEIELGDGARIVRSIEADNGIVHVIDRVLTPPGISF